MGFDRLPIKRNHERPMALELEPEDPRRRGIDETKTQPLATAHGEAIGHATVDRDGIPDPPRHAHFHRAVETAGDRCIVFEPPVAQHPDNVAVHRPRLGLFDNESAHQAAAALFGAMRMGVVPIRAGVRHGEFVIKASVGLDRWLCHAGCTIHRVWHAHAVPVDSGVFRQFVLDHYPQPVTLAQPNLGTGDLAVVGPHACLRVRLADERRTRRFGYEALLYDWSSGVAPIERRYRTDSDRSACQQKRSPGYRLCESFHPLSSIGPRCRRSSPAAEASCGSTGSAARAARSERSAREKRTTSIRRRKGLAEGGDRAPAKGQELPCKWPRRNPLARLGALEGRLLEWRASSSRWKRRH